MVKIVNLTPHTITINGTEIKSSGIARLKQETIHLGTLNGLPVTREVFGDPEGLPEMSIDTIYIVSNIVAAALPHRTNLATPGRAVRDDQGRIIGAESISVRNGFDLSVLDDPNLRGMEFSTDLNRASLRDADLRGMEFSTDLRGIDFP